MQRPRPVERAVAAGGGDPGWWRRLLGGCPQRRAAGAAEAAPPVPGVVVQQHVEVHVHVGGGEDAALAGRCAAEAALAVVSGDPRPAPGLLAGPLAPPEEETPCRAGAQPAEAAPKAGAAAPAARQRPAPRPPPPRPAKAETWAYAVWKHPLQPELRGVHCGGGAAWRAIAASLPNGRYSFASGARLRRFASEAEALSGYKAEAERHEAPLPAPVFDVLVPRRP